MATRRNLIALLIAGAVTLIFWQTPSIIASANLPAVFLLCFCAVSIAAELLFSKVRRDQFRQTYQAMDRLDPDRPHRPKPKTLIVLSVFGLGGSLLLGMPVLPWVFGGLLAVFLFHSAMTRN